MFEPFPPIPTRNRWLDLLRGTTTGGIPYVSSGRPMGRVRGVVAHDTSGYRGRLSDFGNVPNNYHFMFDPSGIKYMRDVSITAPHAADFNRSTIGVSRRNWEGAPLADPREIANARLIKEGLDFRFGQGDGRAPRWMTHPQLGARGTRTGGKDRREGAWLRSLYDTRPVTRVAEAEIIPPKPSLVRSGSIPIAPQPSLVAEGYEVQPVTRVAGTEDTAPTMTVTQPIRMPPAGYADDLTAANNLPPMPPQLGQPQTLPAATPWRTTVTPAAPPATPMAPPATPTAPPAPPAAPAQPAMPQFPRGNFGVNPLSNLALAFSMAGDALGGRSTTPAMQAAIANQQRAQQMSFRARQAQYADAVRRAQMTRQAPMDAARLRLLEAQARRQEALAKEGPRAQERFYGNRIRMIGPDGRPTVGQLSNQGTLQPSTMPEGYQLAPNYERIETDTEIIFLDPVTRQVLSRTPKDIGGGVRQRISAKTQAAAQSSLPVVTSTVDRVQGLANQVLNHEAFGRMTDPYQGRLPDVSAGAQQFRSLTDQLAGTAFVEAFQSIKGGGAITETEGRAATDAISRLRTLSVGSAGYREALEDVVVEFELLRRIQQGKATGQLGRLPSRAEMRRQLGIDRPSDRQPQRFGTRPGVAPSTQPSTKYREMSEEELRRRAFGQ